MYLYKKYWQTGIDFLGTEYAILGGAMSWVSERNLVSAISNAGGFGTIACGSMGPDLLEKEISATKKLTNKPFGVNLIVMHPELSKLVEVCLKSDITHVVFAGGIPKNTTIEQLKGKKIKIISFAPTLEIARKMFKMGVDALIIEGMEAGGHIGKVSTSVLSQEILPVLADQLPIFVAGGIGRGEAIMQYLKMGAAGCQLGTRFVCAHESIAHDNVKELFLRSSSRHAVTSIQLDEKFPVIPVRAIANKASKEFIAVQRQAISEYNSRKLTKQEAQLKIEHYWAGALKRAIIDGDIETGSVMAGQSVGMIKQKQSTKDIINELILQMQEIL